MSNSLFKSKQIKSRRNLKSLNISAPMLADVRESAPVSNTKASTKTFPSVILVAKYSFTAELDAELSVKKSDFVKLLNRPRNGWLFVQYLDSYQARGLIPASYVDIEVNDNKNPISMEWLNEMEPQNYGTKGEKNKSNSDQITEKSDKITKEKSGEISSKSDHSTKEISGEISQISESSSHNLFSFGVSETLEPSTPALAPSSTFQAPATPKSITISNVLQSSVGGVWYRVDVRMSDQSMVYVAKRYQDFYNLHVALLQTTKAISSLPRLPQPIRTNMIGVMSKPRTDRVYLESLLVRCNELNYYVNQLIKTTSVNGMEIYNWIMTTSDPRLIFVNEAAVNMFSEDINKKLYPNSTNVMAVLLPKLTNVATFSPTTTTNQTTNSTSLNSLSSLLDTYEADHPEQSDPNHSESEPDSHINSDFVEPPDSSQDSENSTWELNSAGNSTADTSADESNCEKTAKPQPNVANIDTRVRHPSSSSAESIFSAIHKSAPSTPTFNYYTDQVSPSTPVEFHEELPVEKPRTQSASGPAAGDLIKIKVSLNNAQGDIVALRIKRTNLMSVVYLKKLLSHRIYKDFNLIHHYKLVAEGEKDMDDEALLDYMKLQSKVHLTLRRVRQSSTTK